MAGLEGPSSRRRRRRFHFATAMFEEAGWTLTVDGRAVPLETKPAEILHALLLRAGEVMTKDELLDLVWPGLHVVDASLSVAVSKLRRALGDGGGAIIATVPKIGYRLAAAVRAESLEAPVAPRFAFVPGDSVPGRPQWRLLSALGGSGAADVWRARNEKTGETRVFKFADTPDRLMSLKREAALARLLNASLPDGPHVQLLEWNFTAEPWFIESRDGGDNLIDWASARGGLGAIALAERLTLATAIARALAAVHGAGVLHKDLKPANILVDGAARVRLVDFGSGAVLDDALLALHAITGLPADADGGRSATALYRAPELLAGATPTTRSDLFALGLICLQLAAGNFATTLAPGWEALVPDPLLQGDIRAATAADPAQRLGSAEQLAERLEQLDARRAEVEAAALREQAQARLAAAEARRAARRPWVHAALAAGVAGLAGTSIAAWVAADQRDDARRQAAIAEASYGFLADDLLARVDPTRAGKADEPFAEAVARAAAEIDRRFAAELMVAGRLHHSLARAFDQRGLPAAARAEYAHARRHYRALGAAGRVPAAVATAQLAQMEALSGEPARVAQARTLLDQAAALAPDRPVEAAFWLASATGSLNLAAENVAAARTAYRQAMALAEANPALFPERQRLNTRQRVAFLHLRLGDGDAARALLQPLADRFARLQGPQHPDTLVIRMNLVQALMVGKRNAEAVAAATPLLPLMERAFGPDHRHTLQLLAARQQSLGGLERFAEAAADGERIWRTAARRDGPGAFQAVAGRIDTALSQCRAGDTATGIANARAAIAAHEAAAGRGTALHMALRAILADCLILAGRHAEAGPLLAGIDRGKVGQLVGDANWGAQLDLARAEIALAAGDRATASRLIAAAAPILGAPGAERYQARRLAAVRRQLV